MRKKDAKDSFKHPFCVGIISDDPKSAKNKALKARFTKAFKGAKRGYVYLILNTERRFLKNMLKCMKLMDVIGVNVDEKYQKNIIPHLDSLDKSARAEKRVNIIAKRRGSFVGHFSDDIVADSLKLWK